MLYWVHLGGVGFKLTMLVVICTACTGSCKSNYHMIMTTTAPIWFWNKKFRESFCLQFCLRISNNIDPYLSDQINCTYRSKQQSTVCQAWSCTESCCVTGSSCRRIIKTSVFIFWIRHIDTRGFSQVSIVCSRHIDMRGFSQVSIFCSRCIDTRGFGQVSWSPSRIIFPEIGEKCWKEKIE